ncbi:hypothetical protein Tco_1317905 [Tanacetum coccineum]
MKGTIDSQPSEEEVAEVKSVKKRKGPIRKLIVQFLPNHSRLLSAFINQRKNIIKEKWTKLNENSEFQEKSSIVYAKAYPSIDQSTGKT